MTPDPRHEHVFTALSRYLTRDEPWRTVVFTQPPPMPDLDDDTEELA